MFQMSAGESRARASPMARWRRPRSAPKPPNARWKGGRSTRPESPPPSRPPRRAPRRRPTRSPARGTGARSSACTCAACCSARTSEMAKTALPFRHNGREVAVFVDGGGNLLNALREGVGDVSVKFGCGQGGCGACTVLIDGEAHLSCLTLAETIEGRSVETADGLKSG